MLASVFRRLGALSRFCFIDLAHPTPLVFVRIPSPRQCQGCVSLIQIVFETCKLGLGTDMVASDLPSALQESMAFGVQIFTPSPRALTANTAVAVPDPYSTFWSTAAETVHAACQHAPTHAHPQCEEQQQQQRTSACMLSIPNPSCCGSASSSSRASSPEETSSQFSVPLISSSSSSSPLNSASSDSSRTSTPVSLSGSPRSPRSLSPLLNGSDHSATHPSLVGTIIFFL